MPNAQVGPHDMTVNFDEKHAGKRLREVIKSPTRGMQIGPIVLDKGIHAEFLRLAGCPSIDSLLHPEDAMNVQVKTTCEHFVSQCAWI